MRLIDKRVLLTGATGGIGRELALALSREGADLVLTGRRVSALEELAAEVARSGGRAEVLTADLAAEGAVQDLIVRATAQGRTLHALVNCAGVSQFGLFEQQSRADIERLLMTNLVVPMHLVQATLPIFKRQKQGLIVNVGSVFGSIGFPCFTTYSASKFALRGFSEALRRELAGSGVDVLYVAPRYTRTAINDGAVGRMAEAVAMKQDEPRLVAARIVDAIRKNAGERYFGWPERGFVFLNALFPRWVDRGLRKQTERMRPFAIADGRSSY